MIVIFVVVLVVFGPQKLPELARGLGKLMAEFRKASGDFRTAFEEEMRDIERQARDTERRKVEAASAGTAAPAALPPADPGQLIEPQSASEEPERPGEPEETIPRSAETSTPGDETSGTVPGDSPTSAVESAGTDDTVHDHRQPA